MPPTVSSGRRSRRWASPRAISATWLSTSAPTPKMPETVKIRWAGTRPKGVKRVPSVRMRRTSSPMETLRRLATPCPSTMWYWPRCRLSSRPPSIWAWRMSSLGQRAGSIPCTLTPVSWPGLCNMPSLSSMGAVATTWGSLSRSGRPGGWASMRPAGLVTTTWGITPRMRPLSCPSNPFITEMTTIRAATPMAMPKVENREIKETKRLLRREPA
ncbi:hypothetical protein D3C84_541860 [compost metagenome]